MKTHFRSLTALFALACSFIVFGVQAGSLAELSSAEVVSLLATAPEVTDRMQNNAVNVDGADLIEKVYGVESYQNGKDRIISAAHKATALTPSEEDGTYWLESEDGYHLAYNGMAPKVSAMAKFDGEDNVEEFGYFFVFPYNSDTHATATGDQAAFCGSLLQEFNDMGLDMGVNEASADLFEVLADNDATSVNARLINDVADNGDGRYILFLVVNPE